MAGQALSMHLRIVNCLFFYSFFFDASTPIRFLRQNSILATDGTLYTNFLESRRPIKGLSGPHVGETRFKSPFFQSRRTSLYQSRRFSLSSFGIISWIVAKKMSFVVSTGKKCPRLNAEEWPLIDEFKAIQAVCHISGLRLKSRSDGIKGDFSPSSLACSSIIMVVRWDIPTWQTIWTKINRNGFFRKYLKCIFLFFRLDTRLCSGLRQRDTLRWPSISSVEGRPSITRTKW